MDSSTPGLPVHHQLPELAQSQSHVHWVGDAIQPSHPLSSPSHPAFNLSQHRGLTFSNEPVPCIRWAKYWSFSISPSNEYSGLISFRMDWLDLLAAQGTLKGLLQQHSSKASILRHSAFFIVQLSHPYVTTGKTIALTMQTFVCKVMSLVFHTLSRFAVAFLPKSKCLFVSGGTGEKQTNSGEIFPSGTAKMCSLTGSRQRGWFLDTFALESDWQGSELRQETLGYHSQQWFAGSEE